MSIILATVIAYLVGSVASAIVVSKIMGLPDPRNYGSGNPGATNVLRSGSKVGAGLTLLGDVLKGVIAIIIAKLLGVPSLGIALAGLAVVLGHMFPVFFGFQGGKGVATGFGVFLAIDPLLALLLVGVWLAVALLFGYSSLAALVAAVAGTIALVVRGDVPLMVMGVAVTGLLIWRHKANITRLLNGEESKIKFKRNK